MHETHARSVVKAVTWRALAMAVTLGVAYAMTGSVGKASGIAVFAGILSTFFYYLHERVWNVISWGRRQL